MAEQGLVNPAGAFTAVTTFVSGVDANGIEVPYGRTERVYRANAAVTLGQVLGFVAPTATVPVSVTPFATAADFRTFAGIALESAAAGAYVRVCTEGHCLVNAAAQTVAALDVVNTPGVTAGEASFSATDPTATTIVGNVLGVAFGVKNATTLLVAVNIRQN